MAISPSFRGVKLDPDYGGLNVLIAYEMDGGALDKAHAPLEIVVSHR